MNDELMLLLERMCPEAMELLNAERQAKSKMFQQYDKRIAELQAKLDFAEDWIEGISEEEFSAYKVAGEVK